MIRIATSAFQFVSSQIADIYARIKKSAVVCAQYISAGPDYLALDYVGTLLDFSGGIVLDKLYRELPSTTPANFTLPGDAGHLLSRPADPALYSRYLVSKL